MTEWSNVQWVAAVVGVVLGFGNLAWILVQGRKLHREEQARLSLEKGALALIDRLIEDMEAGVHKPSNYYPVDGKWREVALLAKHWGAVQVRWDFGKMHLRLTPGYAKAS